MRINLAVLALVLAAGAARAQMGTEITATTRTPPSQIGLSLGLGGGVTDYVNSDMTNVADVGGTWEVRGTVGTRLFLAAEAAYVGSRRNIKPSVQGVSGDRYLDSHGVEGVARVQYPYARGAWLIEPFAFGGLGWNHVTANATLASNSPFRDSNDVIVVPFGAGVGATWNGFLLEGRFTYRQTFNEDLVKNNQGGNATMSNWAAGGLVGYEF